MGRGCRHTFFRLSSLQLFPARSDAGATRGRIPSQKLPGFSEPRVRLEVSQDPGRRRKITQAQWGCQRSPVPEWAELNRERSGRRGGRADVRARRRRAIASRKWRRRGRRRRVSYDFRAALGRGSSSGWGGPEETLRGPVALSSASWPSPPPPHQRSDRVGEVPPPPHPGASANCAELGARTPRGPPPAGPGTLGVAFSGLVLWAASASLTCRDDGPAPAGADLLHLLLCSYLAPTLGPSSAFRDFRFLMAPLSPSPSNTRFPPTAVPDRTPTLGLPIVAVRQGSASLFT